MNGLDGANPVGLHVSSVRPDPASGPTTVRLDLAHAAHVQLEVLDLAGRRVRALDVGVLPAGPHDLVWDGRDVGGRETAAGMYWLRVRAGSDEAFRRVVFLR